MVLNPSRNIPASSFVCALSQSLVNAFVIFFLERALISIFSISMSGYFIDYCFIVSNMDTLVISVTNCIPLLYFNYRLIVQLAVIVSYLKSSPLLRKCSC